MIYLVGGARLKKIVKKQLQITEKKAQKVREAEEKQAELDKQAATWSELDGLTPHRRLFILKKLIEKQLGKVRKKKWPMTDEEIVAKWEEDVQMLKAVNPLMQDLELWMLYFARGCDLADTGYAMTAKDPESQVQKNATVPWEQKQECYLQVVSAFTEPVEEVSAGSRHYPALSRYVKKLVTVVEEPGKERQAELEQAEAAPSQKVQSETEQEPEEEPTNYSAGEAEEELLAHLAAAEEESLAARRAKLRHEVEARVAAAMRLRLLEAGVDVTPVDEN